MRSERIRILLSGLPGRMCGEIVARLLQSPEEFEIMDAALTGSSTGESRIEIEEKSFDSVPLDRREEWMAEAESLRPFIAVDYTLPAAIEGNVDFFCRHSIPFVMGTTGGDMRKVRARIADSKTVAVVAPNMAMPIVLLQAAARWVATTFPGALTGYSARIRESHQASKKDTSGTAKALASDLEALGLPIRVEDIEKVRDPATQKSLGVPEEYLDGHAFHTYSVQSPDGSVTLSLSHNILGRRVYADGTIWAIRFLQRAIDRGERGACYNMQDVLRAMAEMT